MRILFQSRKDLFINLGGDTIQILKTKEELEKLGYEIDINCGTEENLSKYDLVHIFNLQTIKLTKKQLLNARKQNKKVVLSTIWWDFQNFGMDTDYVKYSSVKRKLVSNLLMPFSHFNKHGAYCLMDKILFELRVRENARYILKNVDLILPNSIAELEILIQNFNMPELRAKSNVVVNAVDKDIALTDHEQGEIDIPKDYILCVGRIEPIKGQAKILQALYCEKEIPIVFIGKGIDTDYGQFVKEIAKRRTNVYFIPNVQHDKLGIYYKYARVHVLPSLRESPGLVSLEAALYDTNVVISYQTPVQEYFGNNAFICDPEDINSIRNSIMKAYNSDINLKLKSYILDRFTWCKTAIQTDVAYRRVLKI